MALPRSCPILGIGTPILDTVIHINEDVIKKIEGSIGGSEPIDIETLSNLIKCSKQPPHATAGGSAANTIKGLAQLGHFCGLFGRIGNDEAGRYFRESFESLKILSRLSVSDQPTAHVVSLISPDHERTMRYFLGAGLEMKAEDLTPDLFNEVLLVHIEGFLLDRPLMAQRAMQLAKEAGAKISFDLGSFEFVAKYKKEMVDLLSNYVDLVFGNEAETRTLTGLDPEKGCEMLKDICEIAVVKMGENGCFVSQAQEKIFQPAFDVDVIDTTGAGDLFASGFLHGYLSKQSLSECARYGTLVASFCIQSLGSEIDKTAWQTIKTQLAPKS